MKKFLATLIFSLGLMNFACAAGDTRGNAEIEPPKKLSASVDAFSRKYFATLDHNENIFYSPYGIHAALSILANGATGDTREEILAAIDEKNLAELNKYHKIFSAFVEKNYRDKNLFMESNLLLIDKKICGRGLNNDFQRVVTGIYRSDVREADFSGNIGGEKEKISRWVSEKTAGFIPNYNSIATSTTETDLLNVVYFKGVWRHPFRKNMLVKRDFTNRDGSKVKIDIMRRSFLEEIPFYCVDDKFKGIILPYSANAAMYLILPADEDALNVAELWNAEEISYRENFINNLSKTPPFDGYVDVHLPKCELDIENNLVESFKAIGLEKSFSDGAEFFKIVNETQLKIGNAQHRAKILVDEEGTKAAAVTEIAMIETSAPPPTERPQCVSFYAERPFLFMIRDIKSGVMLFSGVVNQL